MCDIKGLESGYSIDQMVLLMTLFNNDDLDDRDDDFVVITDEKLHASSSRLANPSTGVDEM